MSWSFSVPPTSEDGRSQTQRFAEAARAVPQPVQDQLVSWAMDVVAACPAERQVAFASNGHLNEDGTGNYALQVVMGARVAEPEPVTSEASVPEPVAEGAAVSIEDVQRAEG